MPHNQNHQLHLSTNTILLTTTSFYCAVLEILQQSTEQFINIKLDWTIFQFQDAIAQASKNARWFKLSHFNHQHFTEKQIQRPKKRSIHLETHWWRRMGEVVRNLHWYAQSAWYHIHGFHHMGNLDCLPDSPPEDSSPATQFPIGWSWWTAISTQAWHNLNDPIIMQTQTCPYGHLLICFYISIHLACPGFKPLVCNQEEHPHTTLQLLSMA